MKFTKLLCAAAAASVLSACGTETASPIVEVPSYSAGMGTVPTVQDVQSITPTLLELGDAGVDQKIFRGRPSFGSATYSGLILADVNATQTASGRMSLTADFSADTVRGTTDNYGLFTGTSQNLTFIENLTGSIDITDGTISGNTWTGTMAGLLVGNSSGVSSIDATLDGIFVDNRSENVTFGTIDSNDPLLPSNARGIGAFIASTD